MGEHLLGLTVIEIAGELGSVEFREVSGIDINFDIASVCARIVVRNLVFRKC